MNVVPILAPRVRGYILSIVTTPTPTNGVSADVKMLEEFSNMVNIAPINMAAYPVKCLAQPVITTFAYKFFVYFALKIYTERKRAILTKFNYSFLIM